MDFSLFKDSGRGIWMLRVRVLPGKSIIAMGRQILWATCSCLQRPCFGERVKGWVYTAAPKHSPCISLLHMQEELSSVYLRPAGVTTEHLSWKN